MPTILTLQEACEILRCSRPTLRAAIRRNEIVATRFGREWRIPTEALLKTLKAR